MKKIKFLLGALALTAGMTQNVAAQAVEQGNVIIDVYYGFPNLYSAVFRAAYVTDGSTYTDIKVSGLGPLGLRGEYLLTDKFGIGLDIGYNNTHLKFTDTYQDYDPSTGGYVNRSYNYDYQTSKLGVMATFNYHFLDADKVDFYGVIGAGYGNRSFSFKSTDPNYVEATAKSIIPIASKIGVGLRYFFTDNIGANVAVQIGQGGVINAGLSFKF